MTELRFPDSTASSFEAFRNIYTSKPTQDLFDDLVEPEDWPHLQSWENATSQIEHGVANRERDFQYGKASETICVFDDINWRTGRFGDGMSYGVWYGALEEQTSIVEALYWVFRNSREDIERSAKPVVIDRKMYRANIEASRAVDLTKLEEFRNELTSDDHAFCQTLGARARIEKFDLFLSYSARNASGVCVPVLNSAAIKGDRMIYYVHFTFDRNGGVEITTDEDTYFQIPDHWKK